MTNLHFIKLTICIQKNKSKEDSNRPKKSNDSQTFKSIKTAKKRFSCVYIVGATWFDKYFSFRLDGIVFYKSLLLP